MKKPIDQRMTAALVVTLALLWGACANSTSRAPETAGGSEAEVPRDDLVIRRAFLSFLQGMTIDVIEQVRPILESGERVKVRPGLFQGDTRLQEKNGAVVVVYTLRGKSYISGFHRGQELSRAALLADALKQYNEKPTHTLNKADEQNGRYPFAELGVTGTRLSTYSRGTMDQPLNRVWFLKKDGSVLRQRSVSYFASGSGISPESLSWMDKFEFEPASPDELRALVISDDKGVVCFELKPEDWRERPKPWTMSHW